MKFLKETLKKLRWKLLVKVLEKQDELSIKVQDLANQTSVKLQEVADTAAEKTIVSLAQSAIEIRQTAEAGTEKAVASLAKAKTEILSSIDEATAASVNSQDELSVKVEDSTNLMLAKLQETADTATDKTTASITKSAVEMRQTAEAGTEKAVASIAKAKTEILSSIDKTATAVVNRQDELSVKAQDLANQTLAKLRETIDAAAEKTTAELKTEFKALLATDVEKVEPVSLKAEKGLLNYLRLLKGLSKRYTIIIAVKDTTGVFLTDEIADGIKALGFAVDLSFEKGLKKQYHHTYIGVIECGQTVCETLSKQKEPSYYTAARDGVAYEIVSKSFPEGNVAVIKIDGVDYATNRRGLNIAVFDPTAKSVIDSVCFDTQVATLTCSRLEEIVDNLLRKINALALSGYTVPQYCIDNKITSVVVYTEQEYWKIAEDICISFQFNPNVKVCAYCTTKPFRQTPLNDGDPFANVNFVNINDVKLTSSDTVLALHPNPQMEIIKKVETNGARIVTLEQMTRWMYWYIFNGVRALINYSIKYPNVRIVCYLRPSFPAKDLSAGEQEIKDKGITHEYIRASARNNGESPRTFDGLNYTNDELFELFFMGERTHNLDGELVFKDKEGRLVNYVNGHRVTTDQPSQCKRSIFALGRCYMTGVFAPDDKTICSYLQRRFNEDATEFGVVVENYAVFPAGGNMDSTLKKLSYIPVKPNDIILTDIWAPKYFPSIDLRELFQRPHNYGEVWVEPSAHYNERGYRAIADALFKFLQGHDFFQNSLPPPPKILPYLSLRRRRCSAYPKTA
jgi:hypothetical protein